MFLKIFRASILACLLLQACTAPDTVDLTLPSVTLPSQAHVSTEAVITKPPLPTNTPSVVTETPTITPRPSSTPILISLVKGIQMAYVQDDELWLLNEGDKKRLGRVTGVRSIWMSSDGNYIAYNTDRMVEELGFFDLWVTNPQANAKKLVNAGVLKTMASPGPGLEWPQIQLDWIPNTHTLLLTDNDQGRLYAIDAETGDIQNRMNFGKSGYIHSSPDGELLLFVSEDELLVLNRNTGAVQSVLKIPVIRSVTGKPNFLTPVWLPDSQIVRIAVPTTDVEATDPGTEFWEINLATGETARLLELKTAYTLASLSPYGSWVLFSERLVPGSDESLEHHLLNLVDHSDRVIVDSGSMIVSEWSPNEKYVLIRFQDIKIHEKVVTVGKELIIQNLEAGTSFNSWLDSRRYITQSGKIRSLDVDGYFSVMNKFGPFDYIVK